MAKEKVRYLDKVDEILKKNKTLWFFAITFILIDLLLVFGYIGIRKTNIITVSLPKVQLINGGKVILGYDRSNLTYYKAWGRYIVYELGNYNPENINKKINEFAYYMKPGLFKKYKSFFLSFEANVINNQINETFILKDDKVIIKDKGHKAIYKAIGISYHNVGNLVKEKKVCEYDVGFEINNFNIFVTSYKKKCRELGKKEEESKIKFPKERKKDKKGSK